MPAAAELPYWSLLLALSVILAIASITDIKERRIPNWTVLAVAALFVPWAVTQHVSVLSALGAAAIAFAISCAMYAFGVVGAGDSKLLTVTALFAGLGQLLPFLLLVALTGGVVALVSMAARPVRALVMIQMRGKGDFGRGVPYGVAIAVATVGILMRRFVPIP
jgi:prepilin peptidase CpaA